MATSKRREQQEAAHFKERYKIRSGIEATISEANRLTGLKRSWTRGINRVSMSVIFKALATNIKRFIQYALEKAKDVLAPTPGSIAADCFASIWMPHWYKNSYWPPYTILWLLEPTHKFDLEILGFYGVVNIFKAKEIGCSQ
jgi:hypothetical protein